MKKPHNCKAKRQSPGLKAEIANLKLELALAKDTIEDCQWAGKVLHEALFTESGEIQARDLSIVEEILAIPLPPSFAEFNLRFEGVN